MASATEAPTHDAVRDARAHAREANERAATYRAALLDVRQLLPLDSPAVRVINQALAPTAEPRVLLAAHVEHPPLRIHDRRRPDCALDASNEPHTVPLFVARMAGAVPCPRCMDAQIASAIAAESPPAPATTPRPAEEVRMPP